MIEIIYYRRLILDILYGKLENNCEKNISDCRVYLNLDNTISDIHIDYYYKGMWFTYASSEHDKDFYIFDNYYNILKKLK
jgi:hypothetical protein